MNNKEIYSIPVRNYIEIEIDFEKIYQYIVDKRDIKDPDDIYNDFGDNIEFYLEHALNIIFDNTFWTDEDYMIEDDIWSDFGQWLDEHIV